MGKASRTRKKEVRKAKLKAAREARHTLFQKYAEEGRTKGSKRARRNTIRLAKNVDHPEGKCGNVGCKKCFPHLNRDRIRPVRAQAR